MLVTILRTEQVNAAIVGQLGFGRWADNLSFDLFEDLLRAMVDTGHRVESIGILADRIKVNPDEIQRWKQLALQLVTTSELIRSQGMASYYWKEVADQVLSDHASEIAAAIFREQADRASGTWFAEFSEAAHVLERCVVQDPGGVWQRLQAHLWPRANAFAFSIGFPLGLLERMPLDDILRWITENPEERARILANLTSRNLSSDDSLTSRLIGAYGDNERVASAFFSAYISGGWSGPASAHWDQLANSLEEVAKKTALPKLRDWIEHSIRSLRGMAERDRQSEQEEELRWRLSD